MKNQIDNKNKLPKIIDYKALFIYSLIVIISYGLIMFYEDGMIFFGTKHSDSDRLYASYTYSVKNSNFKKEVFNYKNEKIELFTNIKENNNKNVIFLGGNAEDISFNLSTLNKMFPEYNIYTFNYPGYGESTGKSNEEIVTDLISYFIKERNIDNGNLVLMGRSLGTGLATKYAATSNTLNKLILISPYYSLESVVNDEYVFLPKFLTNIIMKNKIETYKYADKVNAKTLIVYTPDDMVIRKENTLKLAEHFKDKEIVLVDGESHQSILIAEKTIEIINKFTKN